MSTASDAGQRGSLFAARPHALLFFGALAMLRYCAAFSEDLRAAR